jgi:hypothetical protein
MRRDDYRHIYPEVTQAIRHREDPYPTPVFPDTCPRCGAVATARGNFFHPIKYACGGSYEEKPQIQNHTDVWWGRCPVTQAAIEAEGA